jgi:glucose/arabinose dehydrogenase
MLLNLATLALLTLFVSLMIFGVLLLRKGRRLLGALLLLEALLALVAQVLLSTFPVGIGDPLIRVDFVGLLTQAFSAFVVVGGVAALVYLAVRWFARLSPGGRQRGAAIMGLLVALPLVASATMYGMTRWSLPERERERDPLKREIKLAPGFAWSVYAQGTIDNPTVITFGPDGKLYIADISGVLWVATDTNGDHKIDTITRWADGFDLLVGLLWYKDELYTASSGKIEALRDTNGDGVADQRRTVVDGLPSMVVRPHSNNSLALGPDNRIYFGVGSTTRGEVEPNEHAAAVLSVNPNGSDLRVFARGFGNPFGVAFNKEGELFGGDNSPLGEGDIPDEFNHIVEGEHYGYPYFYGDPPKNNGTIGALVSFPAHSVPTGVSFYSGNTFPQSYADTAFVTLWGRGEIAHVEVARTNGGTYLSRSSTFGSGFLYPIDAITGPDGNLYVADFGTSAIYRITYSGAQ